MCRREIAGRLEIMSFQEELDRIFFLKFWSSHNQFEELDQISFASVD